MMDRKMRIKNKKEEKGEKMAKEEKKARERGKDSLHDIPVTHWGAVVTLSVKKLFTVHEFGINDVFSPFSYVHSYRGL